MKINMFFDQDESIVAVRNFTPNLQENFATEIEQILLEHNRTFRTTTTKRHNMNYVDFHIKN